MKRRTIVLLAGACMACMTVGCERDASSKATTTRAAACRLAASNSYLEAAVADILGDKEPILRLAEPGMCPGHFDLRPSQISDLRQCRVLLRFDFQGSLDTKLSNVSDDGLKVCPVSVSGGLCEPTSYVQACRQVADALVAAGLIEKTTADRRHEAITARIGATADRCRQQIAKSCWTGRSVVCSSHQAGFCDWLGLKVAATFTGADSAAIGSIEQAIHKGEAAGVGAVIANLPEGRRMADALGDRLKARVVVFGNFPTMNTSGPSFDDLMESNVHALIGDVSQ